MKPKRQLLFAKELALAGLLVCCAGLPALAQRLQLLSVANPVQVGGHGANGDSSSPLLSRDGRFVLFSSAANDLVTTASNTYIPATIPACLNVYLHDRTAQTTVLASENLSGKSGGNADSRPVCISTNGRYVLFESQAGNLVGDDTNGLTDVFVRDVVNGTTLLVSASTNGVTGDGNSFSPSMTPDGRYVAFVSEADDLVPGDTNGIPDVFLRDLQTGTTRLVSVGANWSGSGSIIRGSQSPTISADGYYILFFANASGLVPNVPRGGELYVRDMIVGRTIWASSGARTALSNALDLVQGRFNDQSWAISFNQALSDDGQFVAFETCTNAYPSSAYPALVLRYNVFSGLTEVVNTNAAVETAAFESIHDLKLTPDGRYVTLIANVTGLSNTCVQLWDGLTGTSILVSGNTNGHVTPTTRCRSPGITADGRYVLFWSDAPDLTTNAVAGDDHLFLRDMTTATTALLDADTNGVGSAISPTETGGISDDGQLVAFDLSDGSLIPGDENRGAHVFVSNRSAGTFELVSSRAQGPLSGTPSGTSLVKVESLSGDGRYVAFYSSTDDLTAEDTNTCTDIFLRDRATGKTVLVSANTNGWSSDVPSKEPALSLDGEYVAFTSVADDLVRGDTNGRQDVFVRDLRAATTALVSMNVNGSGPGNRDSYAPKICAGGRFVVFLSTATDLAPGAFAGGNVENVFVRDLQSHETHALTTGGNYFVTPTVAADRERVLYASGTAPYFQPMLGVWDCLAGACIYSNTLAGVTTMPAVAISPDGNRIAYSYHVIPGNGTNFLNVTDLSTGTTLLVDSDLSNAWVSLKLSARGDRLVCVQAAGPGVPDQVYLYNLGAGNRTLVSHSYGSSSTAGNNSSDSPDLSPDGRFVAYRSLASDLAPTDTNDEPDVFLFDSEVGLNTILSLGLSGAPADNRSLRPVFSGDGQTLVFGSWASNIAPLDFNQQGDLFAFVLLSVSIEPRTTAAQGPVLSWPWTLGSAYRVQYKDNVSDSLWQDLDGTISNTAVRAYLQDPDSPGQARFYRVLRY